MARVAVAPETPAAAPRAAKRFGSGAVGAEYARMLVDRETALGVEQGSGVAHRLERRRQSLGAARIHKPMMANMADGGKTPIYAKPELAALGYRLAIFPSITGLAAAAAVEKALNVLKTSGTSNSPDLPLFNFREFNGLIGFEEVWEFERRWARNPERSKM